MAAVCGLEEAVLPKGGREGGKEGGKETVWGRMLTGGKETNSAAPQWEARLLVTWL